ncbi:MAG TPA: LUD domain-containing protein [Acidimicrobiales bacterium]|nr:LUD domain-containing protein [Acidimicrobiales bacterium]
MTAGAGAHPSREAGDRHAFLAGARQRLAGDIFTNPVHVPPPVPAPGAPVPLPGYRNLDPDDLVGTFAAAVAHAEGTCHVVEGDIPDDLLDTVAAELGGRSAVVSAEPLARTVGERLAARGVIVADATPERAAAAGLGVTSAVAAVAATGSVVLDSRVARSRTASLLPAVHLCVVSVNTLFRAPADVLRGLGSTPDALPPSLVLVTGPSRTGDIEQLLTLGAHGPTALHVVLVTHAGGASEATTTTSAG